MKDPNETVHEYDFDQLGRSLHDKVVTFGDDIDSSVQRISTTYDNRGLTKDVTSHDTADVGSGQIVNQVAYEYDSFGQLTGDIQSHDGPVDAQSPRVSYAYENGSQRNSIRRKSITYPDGKKINWQYGTPDSIDQTMSRVKGLRIDGDQQNLVTYTCAGAARYVKLAYPQPNVELSYIKPANEPTRDSGDIYSGYDRFGRTVDMKWQRPDGSEQIDRVQYGYDRAGQRTWRRNLALESGNDEKYSYDNLYQVTDFQRGDLNLNQTAIGGVPNQEEHFAFDMTGNWDRYQTLEDGVETEDQNRAHNQANQITHTKDANGNLTQSIFDRAGNLIKVYHADPQEELGVTPEYTFYTWDGWNRLVKTGDNEQIQVSSYQYDAAYRRTSKQMLTQRLNDNGQNANTTQHYFYNDLWKCVEEREEIADLHQAVIHYFWGARDGHRDELIRQVRNFTADHTGGVAPLQDDSAFCLMDYYNPITTIDTSGTPIERYSYTALGKRTIHSAGNFPGNHPEGFDSKLAFHGEFEDPDTGMHNYGFRYYAPEFGRWIKRDPIEESGGLNIYGFVGNSGVNFSDYLGMNFRCPEGYAVHQSPGTDPREGNTYGSPIIEEQIPGSGIIQVLHQRRREFVIGEFEWEALSGEYGAPCGAELNLEQGYTVEETFTVEITDGGNYTVGYSITQGSSTSGGTTIPGVEGKCLIGIPYVLAAKVWSESQIGTRYRWSDTIDWDSWRHSRKSKVYVQTNWLICSRSCG